MACATQTQFRRGTAAANATFTGVEGEVTYATDTHRLFTHDGILAGGFPLALFSDLASYVLKVGDTMSGVLSFNFDGTAIKFGAASDVFIGRDGAADVLAQVRSTNPQSFRIYNTSTSATNFERLNIFWSANDAIIYTVKGGAGGTARDLNLGADSSIFMKFSVSGANVLMFTPISMGSHKITSVTDPTNPQDAATKAYVDTGLATKQSATAPGANTQVIFNDGGAFGADSGMLYDKALGRFSVGGVFLDGDGINVSGGTSIIDTAGSFSFGSGQFTFDTSIPALNFASGFFTLDTTDGLILNTPGGNIQFAVDGTCLFIVAGSQAFKIVAGNEVHLANDGAQFVDGTLILESDLIINGPNTGNNGILMINPDTSSVFAVKLATGKATIYNSDNTAGNGLASIVGYYDDTKTDANIASTTLFTPPADGLYEVSVVQLVTSHGTSGTLVTTVAWTDEVGSTTATPAASLTVASNGRDSGIVVISATAGNAISFSTTLTSVGSTTYRIKVAVKRLS
jgi:hypothetical protein